MHLIQRFQDYIKQQNLFHSKDKLLLAVSGGIDSVVLCELCKRSGYDFIIAHCNFQLRGEESERDEVFVRSLGEKYKVKVLVNKFETEVFAEKNKISIQEAARELRYKWFFEMLDDKEPDIADYVLTAHHADDNNETLVMNFFRGTGLNGLTGIPLSSSKTKIRRPLLDFWKEELVEFASANKLDFVEDSSNLSSKYTRNLFRNEIIPMIGQKYPQVKENLKDNISRFKEIKKLYDLAVTDFKKKLIKYKKGEIYIPVKQLMLFQSKALIYEIISEYGFTEKQVEEVIRLTESESGRFIQSPSNSTRIIKFRNWLVISANKPIDSDILIIDETVKSLEFGIGKIEIETISDPSIKIPNSTEIAHLDFDEIRFPLLLRKWKAGDYFYPLGMKKQKKLARFFIDQKFSKTQKENTWIIEMNKKIIWVVGHRIDERFKITSRTRKILKLTIKRNKVF